MRKAAILKALPTRAQTKKDLKAAEKALVKISNEVNRLRAELDATEGVTLFDGEPVRVRDNADSENFAAFHAAENVGRFASAVLGDGGYAVTAYPDADSEGTPLGTAATRAEAEKVAKAYAAGGVRKARAKSKAA